MAHHITSLPPRNAYHPARKLFHFATGYIFALIVTNLAAPLPQIITTFFFLLSFSTELVRLRNPTGLVNKLVIRSFRPFMRAHETKTFSGLPYYTFGVALCTIFYPPAAAGVAILCLATLDPIATFTGTLFQSIFPHARLRNGKSLVAFIFSASVGVLIATSTLLQGNVSWNDAQMVGFFAGFVGAFVELIVPTPQIVLGPPHFPIAIDDNAVVPLAVGLLCTVLFPYISPRDIKLAPALLWNFKS